jgi:hypothetical protein
MNIFEAVICHDYTIHRARRKVMVFKTNGVHMIGVCWIANVLTAAGLYLLYFLLTNRKNDVYDLLFEIHYWETAGRIGIIVLLAFVHMLAFIGYGGKQAFARVIQKFISLDDAGQLAVVRRGGVYFYGSLLALGLVGGTLFYIVKVIGY